MSDIESLLGLAIDKNPVDFADVFNNIVREKAAAALDNKRIELANSIYGANEEDEDEVDLEDTASDDDADEGADDDELDLDDLDIDDIDIDLDDLDLNDEDTDEDA